MERWLRATGCHFPGGLSGSGMNGPKVERIAQKAPHHTCFECSLGLVSPHLLGTVKLVLDGTLSGRI